MPPPSSLVNHPFDRHPSLWSISVHQRLLVLILLIVVNYPFRFYSSPSSIDLDLLVIYLQMPPKQTLWQVNQESNWRSPNPAPSPVVADVLILFTLINVFLLEKTEVLWYLDRVSWLEMIKLCSLLLVCLQKLNPVSFPPSNFRAWSIDSFLHSFVLVASVTAFVYLAAGRRSLPLPRFRILIVLEHVEETLEYPSMLPAVKIGYLRAYWTSFCDVGVLYPEDLPESTRAVKPIME